MTQAPLHDGRWTPAILSRLLVVLGLLLFGLPPGHGDQIGTNHGPAAQSQVEQAQGILSVQRHLIREQLPADDLPDAVVAAAVQVWSSRTAVTISAPHLPLLPISNRILPPVRGPPAV